MHLERLEISGFKSFSDRSELAFDRGVTAIVGPNGCGKSNVADALTWVLGEQSAKSLRGDKMEDVIFSGSDARKPTGAAEVRLRFGNVIVPPSLLKELGEDAPGPRPMVNGNGNGIAAIAELIEAVTREVEVTRRLFRSGESEYLIDGQTCRLKDIHELLMDTGLGAKAYAIIEQGKIGMILSSRPTDRRQLIEEAAGITKYKARRRAAELKLEAAQQNLTRLEDIVYEIDKQRGSLKRQAAKARRYTRLRDEMRRWEKVLFARRYRSLSEAIESARARLQRGAHATKRRHRRGWPKSRTSLAAFASSWRRRMPRPRRRAKPFTRTSSRSTAASSRSRSIRSRPKCCRSAPTSSSRAAATRSAARAGARRARRPAPGRGRSRRGARRSRGTGRGRGGGIHARVDGDRSARAGRREGARGRLCRAQHHYRADRGA